MKRVPAASRPVVNKQERAYRLLRQRIENGEVAPGQRLIIDSLALEFGMSQVPIREAIRRLEAVGWIVYNRNTGPIVAQVTKERWEEGMEVLAVAEGYATALAVERLTPQDMTNLRRMNRAMAASVKAADLLGFSKANREFHNLIYKRCPNQYIVAAMRDIQQQLDAIRPTVFTVAPQRAVASIREHDEILRAIEQRKRPEQIERMCRQHKFNTARSARRRPSQQIDLDGQ